MRSTGCLVTLRGTAIRRKLREAVGVFSVTAHQASVFWGGRSMEIKKVYAVHQGDSERHAGKPFWFFESSADAESVAKGRGWWGGKAPTSEHTALIVGEHVYLLARPEPVKLNEFPEDELTKKQKALAKLTKEEQKLLGLM